MSNHTPGPWEAAGSYVRTKRTADGGGFFVADCWRSWDPSNVEFAFDGSEADANARLISAAPDMLDALKVSHVVTKDALDDLRGCGAGDSILAIRLANSERVIREAIAKAEGR